MQRLNILLSRQFIVFVGGGLLCALIDIGVMQSMIVGGYSPIVAASTGFVLGLLVNYAFHAKVTFKNVATPTTFLRFMVVVSINYLITVSMVTLGVAWWHSALVGKLASLPVVAVNGFFLSKYWIFK
jgi:putative flippase GtrA